LAVVFSIPHDALNAARISVCDTAHVRWAFERYPQSYIFVHALENLFSATIPYDRDIDPRDACSYARIFPSGSQ
jgi:hypothetical protein